MQTVRRFRTTFLVTVVVVAFALIAPGAVNAQEEVVTEEQSRAAQEQASVLAPAVPSWDETSGYGAVEASRADVSALLSSQLMSGQEQFLALAVATVMAWDDTSGYGSLEASRAAIGHEDGVSSYTLTGHEAGAAIDLSWDRTSGYGAVEASRAERALDGALAAC
jgi:hypothetical protein